MLPDPWGCERSIYSAARPWLDESGRGMEFTSMARAGTAMGWAIPGMGSGLWPNL